MLQTGRCLCGEIRYEIDGDLPPLVNCHCQYCRRAHGAAFITLAWLPRSCFRFTAGEQSVTRYTVGDGYRCFCKLCGTRIFNGQTTEAGFISLIISTLDDGSHPGPVLHMNIESKAAWHVITDDLPQHHSFSPEVISDLKRLRER